MMLQKFSESFYCPSKVNKRRGKNKREDNNQTWPLMRALRDT